MRHRAVWERARRLDLDTEYLPNGPRLPLDDEMADLVGELAALPDSEWQELRAAVPADDLTVIGRFAARCSRLALRSREPSWVEVGLQASALGLVDWEDPRDVMVNLALPYEAAVRLGLDPKSLFAEVAPLAPAGFRDLFRDFGARKDVNLRSFWWREVESEHGVAFEWPDRERG